MELSGKLKSNQDPNLMNVTVKTQNIITYTYIVYQTFLTKFISPLRAAFKLENNQQDDG